MVEGTPTGFEPVTRSSSSLENIRDYIDGRLAEADRRYQMRYDFTDKALAAAQENNNDRLNGMNEFRGAIADQAARLPTRTEIEVMIASVRAENAADLAPIYIKVDSLGKPNVALIAALFGITISVVSAAWVIIGLKIDATNLPVEVAIQASKTDVFQLTTRMSAVEGLSTGSAQADAASKTDRAQLNDRMKAAEGLIALSGQADSQSRADRSQLNSRLASSEDVMHANTNEVRTLTASTSAKLVEVETQFKLLSDILNLDKDQDQRLFSLLWKKAYPGEDLPQLPFRPQMFKE